MFSLSGTLVQSRIHRPFGQILWRCGDEHMMGKAFYPPAVQPTHDDDAQVYVIKFRSHAKIKQGTLDITVM